MKTKTFYGTQGPLLTVYRLLKVGRLSFCIHHFHTADEDPDCHDHPFSFFTMVLRGGYLEEMVVDPDIPGYVPGVHGPIETRFVERRPFSMGFRKASCLHRVAAIASPCWTCCVKIAPKNPREWGFITENGWVQWQDYIRAKGLEPVADSEDAF